jgi:hypothetical protein
VASVGGRTKCFTVGRFSPSRGSDGILPLSWSEGCSYLWVASFEVIRVQAIRTNTVLQYRVIQKTLLFMSLRARLLGFDSRQDSCILHSVQTDSGAHNVYRGLFPRAYSGRGMKLTTNLHLVPRSKLVELYLHPSLSPLVPLEA